MKSKIRIVVCFILLFLPFSNGYCDSPNFGGDTTYTETTEQAVNTPKFSNLVQKFHEKSGVIAGMLQPYAKRIFRYCLVIDIVLFAIAASMQRASFEEIFSRFLLMLMFAGFVWTVIGYYQEWCNHIVNGLLEMSISFGAPPINQSPLDLGIAVYNRISFTTAGPVDSIGIIIISSVVLACFALMTAQIILVNCESFLVMAAGMLLLGFGGLGILKDYAISTMRYAFAVAFKLFVMQLLLALGMEFFNDFAATTSFTDINLAVLGFYLATVIILLRLVMTIPDQAAGLINGSHVGSGHGMFATAAAVGSATASAIKTTLGGAAKTSKGAEAVYNAVKAGNAQHFQTAGQLSGGFGGAARNMWDAYRASIQNRDDHGRLGQRMSSQLKTAAATGERPQANSMPHSFMSSETNQAGSIGSSGVSGQSATSQTGPAPEVPTVDKQSVRRHASEAAAATQHHENQD